MSDTAVVKSRLESRRAELQQRLSRVEVDRRHQAEPLEADFAEQAAQTGNDEVLGAIGDTLRAELGDIDAALVRLAAGHYGDCAACGKAIEAARLEAVPYALRCAHCA
jgi:RNA polymerase-binding transcription factor DksA